MRVLWALFASDATASSTDITELQHPGVTLFESHLFPAAIPHCVVAFSLELEYESEWTDRLSLDFLDADARDCGKVAIQLDYQHRRKDIPLRIATVIPIEGIPLPHPGDYVANFIYRGRILGRITFNVRQLDEPPT